MIAEADVSGDGRVDYTEFAHLWKTFLMEKHHKPVAGRLQQVKARRRTVYLVVGDAPAPFFAFLPLGLSFYVPRHDGP